MITYPWRDQLGALINSGQTRSIVLCGDVHDLFQITDEEPSHGRFVNLTEFLQTQWQLPQTTLIILKVDGTLEFVNEGDRDLLARTWVYNGREQRQRERKIQRFVRPYSTDPEPREEETFEQALGAVSGNPAAAITLLRELCRLSRGSIAPDAPLYQHRLIILVEHADILLPEGLIHQLGAAYQSRIIQMREWFADPEFNRGDDFVVLVSESASQVNHRIVRLPQVLTCEIPFPDEPARRQFIDWFDAQDGDALKLWSTKEELAQATEVLDLHALLQLLKHARHAGQPITLRDVDTRVEAAIQKLLGSGDGDTQIVRFYRPTHTRADLVGLSAAERTADDELVHRYRSRGKDALSNTLVVGPIGSGKTYRFGAIAGELGMPVLELGQFRSMWYGGTDVKLDRLRRVLDTLSKVVIMIDEGDTQLSKLGEGVHETEQRATGTFQRWMSDPRYKGRVIWLQLSARPQRFSADLKRKGRGGSLIYPVFDPVGEALDEVVEWMLKPSMEQVPGRKSRFFLEVRHVVEGWSMADLAHMRDELRAIAQDRKISQREARDRILDELPGEIGAARRFQILQALLHCTRQSLIPKHYLEGRKRVDDELRAKWREEARLLAAMGVN